VWIADYVLTGYGTGAIMAVPGHDERDYAFASKFDLPIVRVVDTGDGDAPMTQAMAGHGTAVNSGFLDGKPTAEAKSAMIDHLDREGIGRRRTNYKLRDWLFSRQRYWGEPFPILLDSDGLHHAVDEEHLPVRLPDLDDFRPTGSPEGPLAKAEAWLNETRDGRPMRRETNTMPQWAGSCWYYLRYLDPTNSSRFIDPEKEKYWMPVDLYVGGAEHAVLHLLYARFWHKILYDLGHLSTKEPFARLVNQGMILGETEYRVGDVALQADEVEKRGNAFHRKSDDAPVEAKAHKMSKSRGNVINPDDVVSEYGADVFRLYEMYMGPLEATKPWNTQDIVGMSRFLSKVWRTLVGVDLSSEPVPEDFDRRLNRGIKRVGDEINSLRFNTAIAELIELINEAARLPVMPRAFARVYTLLLSPFAPHLAEEIWRNTLDIETSVVLAEWPTYDEAKLVETSIELPVQVNGKLRGRVTVSADASKDVILAAAEAQVASHVQGKTFRKKIVVPGRLVNLVVS
jgi:leucyl-tRNA synthetase